MGLKRTRLALTELIVRCGTVDRKPGLFADSENRASGNESKFGERTFTGVRALPLNIPMLSPKPVERRTRSTPLPFPHGAGRKAGSMFLREA